MSFRSGFYSLHFMLAILAVTTALSQEFERPNRHYQKDFKRACDVLLETHPEPYWKKSEKEIASEIDKLSHDVEQVSDDFEFYDVLTRLVNCFEGAFVSDTCGGLRATNTVGRDFGKGCFPYQLFLSEEDRLYVLNSKCPELRNALPKGAEIVACNGKSIKFWLSNLKDSSAVFRQAVQHSLYSSFNNDLILNRLFGSNCDLKLEYIYEGQRRTIVVENVFENEVHKCYEEYKKTETGNTNYLYDYIQLPEGVVQIKFNFEYYGRGSITGIEQLFQRLEKDSVEVLFLDFRNSKRVSSYIAVEFLHHLMGGSFKLLEATESCVSKWYKDAIQLMFDSRRHRKKYAGMSQKKFRPVLHAIAHARSGKYVTVIDHFIEEDQEKPNEYKGDVYVLMNNHTLGLSALMVSVLQCYNRAWLAGTPSLQRGVFFTSEILVDLPKTKFTILVPTTKAYLPCKAKRDQRLTPDIPLRPRFEDLLRGDDSMLIQLMEYVGREAGN